MHVFLKKLLICCLLILIQTNAISQSLHSCKTAKLIVSKFVTSKKNEDWDKIEAKVYNFQHCKCEMAPVFYYIYRMHALLPNSQALQGKSPDDFITNQKFNMQKQKQILLKCNVELYLPLINTMSIQRFDSEIRESAKELQRELKP